MMDQLLTMKQASEYLYGTSRTVKEANENYIKLLLLTDKGLKTQRIFETSTDGKQTRRVKVSLADLQVFKQQLEKGTE